MMTFRPRFVQPVLLALSAAAFLAGPAVAEDKEKEKKPKLTEWMFMERTPTNQEGVDWEAEGSIEIKTDSSFMGWMSFGTPIEPIWTREHFTIYDEAGEELLYLGGTRWRHMSVEHTTSSGKQVVRSVWWLVQDVDGDGVLDEPKKGMKAATGPDGDVTHFTTALAALIDADDPYGNGDKWRIVQSGGHYRLWIAVGLFKD